MSGPDRIEGLAIVSADGMIADARGVQTDAIKLEADQRFFHAMLNEATALAHGRHSGEGDTGAPHRRRLILTRSVAAIEHDPRNANAVHWNPGGAGLQEAWEALGLSGGLLGVIGGTDVFGLFLEIGYDAFHLSRAGHAKLPGGRPVFPGVPQHSPEVVLACAGMKPGPTQVLDPSAGLTLVTWER